MNYQEGLSYNFYGNVRDVYFLQDYSLCITIETRDNNLVEFSTKSKTLKNIFYGRDNSHQGCSINATIKSIDKMSNSDKNLIEVTGIKDIDIY